jgi:hypothetical protein
VPSLGHCHNVEEASASAHIYFGMSSCSDDAGSDFGSSAKAQIGAAQKDHWALCCCSSHAPGTQRGLLCKDVFGAADSVTGMAAERLYKLWGVLPSEFDRTEMGNAVYRTHFGKERPSCLSALAAYL